MKSTTHLPLPVRDALRRLGRHVAIARRKRGISTADMAGRLFCSRDTLWRLERGDPSVALGTFVTAAYVLNLLDRFTAVVSPEHDRLGLELDADRLPRRIRRPKRSEDGRS